MRNNICHTFLYLPLQKVEGAGRLIAVFLFEKVLHERIHFPDSKGRLSSEACPFCSENSASERYVRRTPDQPSRCPL